MVWSRRISTRARPVKMTTLRLGSDISCFRERSPSYSRAAIFAFRYSSCFFFEMVDFECRAVPSEVEKSAVMASSTMFHCWDFEAIRSVTVFSAF
jgi:hypothetical protein